MKAYVGYGRFNRGCSSKQKFDFGSSWFNKFNATYKIS